MFFQDSASVSLCCQAGYCLAFVPLKRADFRVSRGYGSWSSLLPWLKPPSQISACVPTGASAALFAGLRGPDLLFTTMEIQSLPTAAAQMAQERNTTQTDFSLVTHLWLLSSFPGGSVIKNLLASAGDMGLIPGRGRSPGSGNSNPLQWDPMSRGIWWTIVLGVAESDATEDTGSWLLSQVTSPSSHSTRCCFLAQSYHTALPDHGVLFSQPPACLYLSESYFCHYFCLPLRNLPWGPS